MRSLLSPLVERTPGLSDLLGLPIPWVSTVVSVVILFGFLWTGCILLQTWLNTRQQIKKANDDLASLKATLGHEDLSEAQFNQVHIFLKNKPALQYSLEEMQETIVTIPRNGRSFFHNSIQAETFFTHENVCHEIPGWLSSVPGILTGAGLLGTFLALLCGLGELHVDGGNVKGIEPFINSLSGKFSSSIVGLFCAIGFTFLERRWLIRAGWRPIHTTADFKRSFPPPDSRKASL